MRRSSGVSKMNEVTSPSRMDSSAVTNDEECLPLPRNKMPKAWWDEDEIGYFFSPFRSYNQNPEDKENKLKFWAPLIFFWCEHNDRCTFTVPELEKAFQKDTLVPACLSGIVEEMLRMKQLIPREEFMKMPSQTWSGWAFNLLVKKPAGWSLKKAKEIIGTEIPIPVYIHLEAVKLQAEHLVKEVREFGKGPLLSKSEVADLTKWTSDLDFILHYLLCQGKISIASHKDETVIKLLSKEKCKPINEIDLGIYALQQTEKSLSKNLEKLEAEKLATIEMARCYITKGMKQMAKSRLRKKQELEKCLEKRASVLENVQILLSRIQQSHSDSQVLETYQQGLAALKFTMKEANLTDENVSNTMLEMSEVLDAHEDIQQSLSQSAVSTDDSDLEEELARLLLSDSPSPAQGTPEPVERESKEDPHKEMDTERVKKSIPEPAC